MRCSLFGCCGRGSGSPALPSAAPSAAVAPTSNPNPPLPQGARVYERYCQLCHAKDATGYAADNAPSLVSKTFLESASDQLIAAGIRMGRPGTAMAAYGKVRGGPLEEREIDALVAFLRSKGPGNAAPGCDREVAIRSAAPTSTRRTASCHGKPTAVTR